MYRRSVKRGQNYIIYGSARLPQDGIPGDPAVSVYFLSRTIIFGYLNIIRRWRPYILVLTLFQLYATDVIEYFSDRIPTNQLRLHLLAELTSKVDNTTHPTEYRFHAMTAGYCPYSGRRDDSKLRQE